MAGSSSLLMATRLTSPGAADRARFERYRFTTMTEQMARWSLEMAPLFALTVIAAHLMVSSSQTFLHYSLGHHRRGWLLFHSHIKFHHGFYARGHLVSPATHPGDGNITPLFIIPAALAAGVLYAILPFVFFIVAVAAIGISFYGHVYLDNAYHASDTWLSRFAWFRRKQQLHFVHHLHANSNFAVIDFFWDRLLGTYRRPDSDVH